MAKIPQSPENFPDILTADQVASMLGKSVSSIRQNGVHGCKPLKGYGRYVRYLKSDVLKAVGITKEPEGYSYLMAQIKRQQTEIDALRAIIEKGYNHV